MKGNNRENELKELQQLIEQEKNMGLEQFRLSDFESKLHQRLQTQEPAATGIRSLLLRPVPLAVLIICLFLAVWSIYTPLRTTESSTGIQTALTAVLEKTRYISSNSRETNHAPEISAAQAEFYRLEWSIQYVLNTVYLQLGDQNIPELIQQVLETAVSGNTEKLATFSTDKQALAEDINAVRKQGDYSLFFIQILKKLQEV